MSLVIYAKDVIGLMTFASQFSVKSNVKEGASRVCANWKLLSSAISVIAV